MPLIPKSMDPQAANWPFIELDLFATRAKQILQYPHQMTCILLDLHLLAEKDALQGEEKALSNSLSRTEQDLLRKFTLAKRKREWLGGRLAAKYATARLLEVVHSRQNAIPWKDFSILAAENGRPYIAAADKTETPMPDISISHSGSFASALAVHKGFGGIDVQEITPKVMKVKDRFRTTSEERILQNSFPETLDITGHLTKLWAAKEAMRKAAGTPTVPGFLEMQLVAIKPGEPQNKSTLWNFIFKMGPSAGFSKKNYSVAVTDLENYALAVTARDDTLA